ncbi:hypothetical protein INS49_007893 [Diaporthe citri]|uniref:uncharacterized protein n=1 Tax=Diaporthe citri TaxID=83186 RepID=UPI001C80290D|nr:uncharacterized protein INS49_007893 [Diaporthe citri]KAG6362799.1 hypothetical protein INS49_007893 [Diaporthe citri]
MAQMGPKLSLNAADRTQTGTGLREPPDNHRHLMAQNGATFSSPGGRKIYPPPQLRLSLTKTSARG